MDYADRINKFNDMIGQTSDHIKAVRDAATKFDDKDPVGSALNIATAASGGVGGVAGSIAGIQHFKDAKTIVKRVAARLGKKSSDAPSGGSTDAGSGSDSAAGAAKDGNVGSRGGSSQGGSAADNDGQAPRPTGDGTGGGSAGTADASQAGQIGADIDGGVADRVGDLANNPFPTQEANAINKAIEAKTTAAGVDKGQLNSLLKTTGRQQELKAINKGMNEGDLKTASQQDFLQFKNKVANDAISRANSGRPQASGYDSSGNPTGEAQGPSLQSGNGTNGVDALRTAPDAQASGAPVQAGNNAALAPDPNAPNTSVTGSGDLTSGNAISAAGDDLDQGASLVARGQAALQNLVPANVPGRAGQLVRGLATQNPDASQGANMASRLQQGAADAHASANSAMANPNATNAGNLVPDGQGAANATVKAGAASADAGEDAGSIASKVASGASKLAEGSEIAGGVESGLDVLAGLSGPLAPVVGLVSGLVSLGTTIAGLFHHKPPPKKEAPPPAAAMSVGANLQQNASAGVGIY